LKYTCSDIDPPVYDSTNRKLKLSNEYCVYSSTLLKCVSNYIDYDTTNKRLKYVTNISTTLDSDCPAFVDYDSYGKKLVKTSGMVCVL